MKVNGLEEAKSGQTDKNLDSIKSVTAQALPFLKTFSSTKHVSENPNVHSDT